MWNAHCGLSLEGEGVVWLDWCNQIQDFWLVTCTLRLSMDITAIRLLAIPSLKTYWNIKRGWRCVMVQWLLWWYNGALSFFVSDQCVDDQPVGKNWIPVAALRQKVKSLNPIQNAPQCTMHHNLKCTTIHNAQWTLNTQWTLSIRQDKLDYIYIIFVTSPQTKVKEKMSTKGQLAPHLNIGSEAVVHLCLALFCHFVNKCPLFNH